MSLEGLSQDLAILPGLAAVLGHNYPVYLNFKGGRGAAALFGLNLIAIFYTRSFWLLLLLAGSLVYSAVISEEREKIWTAPPGRISAKLSALILPIGFIWFSKEIVLTVTILLFISLFFDIVRFLIPKINLWYLKSKKFAKEKELRRFSGYSLFLISAFLLFEFFPKEIAVISLTFFIIGDVLAPAGQLRYMPHYKVLGGLSIQTGKPIGGAMVIFLFSIAAGLFIQALTPLIISQKTILLGALLTAVFDQLSVFIDDNLLVPLGTALLITVLARYSLLF